MKNRKTTPTVWRWQVLPLLQEAYRAQGNPLSVFVRRGVRRMAKETGDNKEKAGFFKKVGLFFKNLFWKVVNSFKNMAFELKKVTWPTRSELINYSLVVLAFMVAMAVIIGVIDAGAAKFSQWIIGA
jgi:preprotein translocase subunit SecE